MWIFKCIYGSKLCFISLTWWKLKNINNCITQTPYDIDKKTYPKKKSFLPKIDNDNVAKIVQCRKVYWRVCKVFYMKKKKWKFVYRFIFINGCAIKNEYEPVRMKKTLVDRICLLVRSLKWPCCLRSRQPGTGCIHIHTL